MYVLWLVLIGAGKTNQLLTDFSLVISRVNITSQRTKIIPFHVRAFIRTTGAFARDLAVAANEFQQRIGCHFNIRRDRSQLPLPKLPSPIRSSEMKAIVANIKPFYNLQVNAKTVVNCSSFSWQQFFWRQLTLACGNHVQKLVVTGSNIWV